LCRRFPSMASRRSLLILVWYPLPWRFSEANTSPSTRIVTGFLDGAIKLPHNRASPFAHFRCIRQINLVVRHPRQRGKLLRHFPRDLPHKSSFPAAIPTVSQRSATFTLDSPEQMRGKGGFSLLRQSWPARYDG